jgi:hypothetical protein
MKKLIILSISTIFITKVYSQKVLKADTYQVMSIESDNVKGKEGKFLYENKDIAIVYDFWAEKGNVWMEIVNKTDSILTIDFGKSKLITNNNLAVDYWSDKEEINSIASSYYTSTYSSWSNSSASSKSTTNTNQLGSYGYSNTSGNRNTNGSVYGSGSVSGFSVAKTDITRPMRYINIPPKSAIRRNQFIVTNDFYFSPDFLLNNVRDKAVSIEFNQKNTPIKFTNFISYSFIEGSSDVKSITNKFWVNSVTNTLSKEFKGEKVQRKHYDEYGNITTKFEYSYPFAKPNTFYLFRKKTETSCCGFF